MLVDPSGTSATVAGCVAGSVGGAISGFLTNISSFWGNPGTACCKTGCSIAGGCITGLLPGIAVDTGQAWFVTYAACLGGALGNIATTICEAKCDGQPINAECLVLTTVANGILGCIGGYFGDVSETIDGLDPLFIALGMDTAALGSLCGPLDDFFDV